MAAYLGQPGSEEVPGLGPVHRSYCPQPKAGKPTMGEANESPNSFLVDGRCFAPSASLPSGTGPLAAALTPAAAPLGK